MPFDRVGIARANVPVFGLVGPCMEYLLHLTSLKRDRRAAVDLHDERLAGVLVRVGLSRSAASNPRDFPPALGGWPTVRLFTELDITRCYYTVSVTFTGFRLRRPREAKTVVNLYVARRSELSASIRHPLFDKAIRDCSSGM